MTTNSTYTTLTTGTNGVSSDDMSMIPITGDASVNLPVGVTTTPWNGTYTINDNWSITDTSAAASVHITGKGIVLDDDADIQIKGRQLSDILAGIESRLGLLTANHQLEAEFEELKALGDQYRELERRLNEQLTTWDILKKT